MPEYVFRFVRGIAGVGAVVCMIAAVELGPLAFAGAGAFALMAFGFMNYQKPEPTDLMFYFAQKNTIFDVCNSGCITLASHPYKLISSGDIFCSLDDKEEILKLLKSVMNDYKIVEIKRHKDLYEHADFPTT